MSTPDSSPHLNIDSDAWIDFYALLDLPMDAGSDFLRRTIGAKYAEARANYDHRDLNQRHYYQALSERILPQCRRILLDEQKRALYDEQCRLHRAHDPRALGYVAFRAALKNPETLKGKSTLSDLPALDSQNSALSGKLKDEIEAARTLVSDMENGLALDLLPAASFTTSDNATAATTRVIPPQKAPEHDIAALPVTSTSAPAHSPKTEPAPAAMPHAEPAQTASGAAPNDDEAARVFDAAFVRVAGSQSYLESTSITGEDSDSQHLGAEALRNQPIIINGRPVEKRPAGGVASVRKMQGSRLSVGEMQAKRRPSHDDRRILSPLALNLMTAIVAVLLTFTIQYFTNSPVVATANRVPLVISYSPEMKPFLETARSQFEETENGALIELILQPQDERAGLRQALGQGGTPPDVWIPAETMWPERYNQMAASHRRSVISTMTPLALSPLVLVARADRAGPLLKRFPNRRIPSWEALRVVTAHNAPGRLGMPGPTKSGSGAITRYFMAREWSNRHKVAVNDAAGNPALWQWMTLFEKNIPAAGATTAELTKDMVLGTRGLYWWTIAYESDAIYWLQQNRNVEIFYLPATSFAEHPFCHIARLDAQSHPQARTAAILFERFLRTASMQQALLQHGFRPTEIDLQATIEGNPFREAKFKKRGLQNTGFPLDERLDYRVINEITSGWNRRFTS